MTDDDDLLHRLDEAANDTHYIDPQTAREAAARIRELEAERDAAAIRAEQAETECLEWRRELTVVMPPDFKDWHENSPHEWPKVAAGVIRRLKGREEFAWAAAERAEAALASLRHAANEASDPDFLFGAMDNVNDMDVSLIEFAAAASRAIRAAMEPAPAPSRDDVME